MRDVPEDARLIMGGAESTAQVKAQTAASQAEYDTANFNATRHAAALEELADAGITEGKRYDQVEWGLKHWNTRARVANSRLHDLKGDSDDSPED